MHNVVWGYAEILPMSVLQHTRNERNPCLKKNRPDSSYRDTLSNFCANVHYFEYMYYPTTKIMVAFVSHNHAVITSNNNNNNNLSLINEKQQTCNLTIYQ